MKKVFPFNIKPFLFALFLVFIITFLSFFIGLTPVGKSLEENFGLPLLFSLKGKQNPPDDAVIISLDRQSQHSLNLQTKTRQWPRDIHAQLINKLKNNGTAAIGFDIFFREKRSNEGSNKLANAIEESGNVVLFQYIQLDNISDESENRIQMETLISPLPDLANAANALAPFPLPRKPIKISQAWLFKPELGDIPTLPVVMLQVYYSGLDKALVQLIIKSNPVIANNCTLSLNEIKKQRSQQIGQSLRQCFLLNTTLEKNLVDFITANPKQFDETKRNQLLLFIDIFAGTHSRYLNFYGGRQAITTFSYEESLLHLPRIALNKKAIFIGYSEKLQTEHKDDFDTVYPGENGTFISGVEIAATLFSNLIAGNSLKPINNIETLALFLTLSLISITLLRLTPIKTLFFIAAFIAITYSTITFFLFANQNIWLPIVSPVFLQLPFVITLILLWRYYDTNKERQCIRDAFSYHLPPEEVNKIANNVSFIQSHSPEMYGICLATDAGQYTALSENSKPEDLRLLMNNYYNAIFGPVRQEEGYISDVVGDSMLAIWAENNATKKLHRQACNAALGIQQAADTFNRLTPSFSLPTRIGLHSGEVVLGHVGAKDHYEYRAVGDIVNTATRIEGLNKILCTRILVTKNIVEMQENIVSRDLGLFILVGKQNPVHIFELIGFQDDIDELVLQKNVIFEKGLIAFRKEEWSLAVSIFAELLKEFGNDGPTTVYLNICESLANPNNQVNKNETFEYTEGAIRIHKK